jgi:hypothetical protein
VIRLTITFLVLFGICGSAFAEGVCEGSNREGVCLKMRHLRASVNALDAQRELMQITPNYLVSLGVVLLNTAQKVRADYGFGIPEHLMGLSGIEKLSRDLTAQAAANNVEMLKTANLIRNQCASCHATSNHVGGVDWDNIFDYDWNAIAAHCNSSEANPYLCKSMNGMLSAYGYLITGYQAGLPDFAMTRQAAEEIARILVDLKAKGFNHLPEELRAQAEAEAREVSAMAADKNPDVFLRATQITNACQKCHEKAGGPNDFGGSMNWRKFSWGKAS